MYVGIKVKQKKVKAELRSACVRAREFERVRGNWLILGGREWERARARVRERISLNVTSGNTDSRIGESVAFSDCNLWNELKRTITRDFDPVDDALENYPSNRNPNEEGNIYLASFLHTIKMFHWKRERERVPYFECIFETKSNLISSSSSKLS